MCESKVILKKEKETIPDAEKHKRWQRARDLKNFACFNGCATYPNCERLSADDKFNELIKIKEDIKKAVVNVMSKHNKDKVDFKGFSFELCISCKEYRRIPLDLGD